MSFSERISGSAVDTIPLLNSCSFHFMFTPCGRSNLTCFNALSQKVVINYPLAGGEKKIQYKKKKKKKS